MQRNSYVYYLTDPDTGQPFYVGKGSHRRMYEHNRIRNRLTNPLLKAKLCKLHKSNKPIVYEKVLINATEEEAFKKEVADIATYGKKIDGTGILCNLTDGGEGSNLSWTPERRKQKSKSMKGKRGYLPIVAKSVSQFTLDGQHLADFPSAKVASEKIKEANQSYITQCCKDKRRSSGGFLWAYKGRSVPLFTKKYYKPVVQKSTNGALLRTFCSLTEAEKHTGVELHNISACCRGKSKTAGGFVWRYV